MAQVPDFLLIHCTTSDRAECASCGRDFLVPISAIAAFFRRGDGTVAVHIKKDVLGSGRCTGLMREFSTATDWNTLVTGLNGTVDNIGDVQVGKV